MGIMDIFKLIKSLVKVFCCHVNTILYLLKECYTVYPKAKCQKATQLSFNCFMYKITGMESLCGYFHKSYLTIIHFIPIFSKITIVFD